MLLKMCEAIEGRAGKSPVDKAAVPAANRGHAVLPQPGGVWQHVPMGRGLYGGQEVVVHISHLLAHGAFIGAPETGKGNQCDRPAPALLDRRHEPAARGVACKERLRIQI